MNNSGRNREARISRRKILVEIVRVVVCISKAVKIKEHLPICREFSTIRIEDRAFVDRVV